jgi:predicted metalloprotease with PDZ domain
MKMKTSATRKVLALCALLLVALPAMPARNPRKPKAPPPSPSITITVDASEAPRHILHARLLIPATPGEMTLYYPKWVPGEHGPTGPIADLAGVKFAFNGQPLPWRRDLVDMYAFIVQVPQAATTLEVTLDFLLPSQGMFSGGASASAQIAVLSWNQVLLYPKGWTSDELTYAATLRLPPGWKYGTALDTAKESPQGVEFAPVSLTTLVDSPVILGAHYRAVPLAAGETPSHEIDMAADSEAALAISTETREAYNQLVAETGALFGARHYRHYHFLLSLSDNVAHFGLEHHESSDDRIAERSLVDEDLRKASAGLLPHEFVHTWNGKYRRPADLSTPDFQQPMKTDLLWVYEGLTQYLGDILTPRSGLETPEQYREDLALVAADLDNRAGRTWRPLADTAVAAQILYGTPSEWSSWRRGVDFYDEGDLIWLEADVTIRQLTHGQRSLDDFCHRFHGGQSGPPQLKTYTFDDVVKTLNDVAPYDWNTFLTARLNSTSPRAPLGGIEGGGWKLVYNETLPGQLQARESAKQYIDVSYSLGFRMSADGAVLDVLPGTPAAEAGLAPGAKILGVDGRRWTHGRFPNLLREAIRAAKGRSEPLRLLVENADYYKTIEINYHGGERYPHLERDASKPDLLGEIIKPHATPGP